MSVTSERIGELPSEAEAPKAEGRWSLEHYERLVNEAVSLLEAGSVQGRLLEPFVRLAPRAWREQVAARRRSRFESEPPPVSRERLLELLEGTPDVEPEPRDRL